MEWVVSIDLTLIFLLCWTSKTYLPGFFSMKFEHLFQCHTFHILQLPVSSWFWMQIIVLSCPLSALFPFADLFDDWGWNYFSFFFFFSFQPSSIVTDEICTACDFNRPEKNCLRKLEWVWRGETFMAKRRFFSFLIFLWNSLMVYLLRADNAAYGYHSYWLQWLLSFEEATWIRVCWWCWWSIVKIFCWPTQSGAAIKTQRTSEEILSEGSFTFFW